MGDVDSYNDILKDYVNISNERIIKLNNYRNDMTNYEIEVHSLKSDSKYLGINSLADIAYQHELKSKENNINYISTNFDSLISEYKKALNIIKTYLNL